VPDVPVVVAGLGGADSVLKVPRRYDRAQVRPGMDLYESVIAVDRNTVCVLRCRGRRGRLS
jgi:hypothetical protein